MERLFKIRIFTAMFFLAITSIATNARESKKESDNYYTEQILIVGLHGNVESNYLYNGMVAKETDMKADNIGRTYNMIIAENIVASVKNGDCRFIPANATQVTGQVLNEIKVNGKSEDCYSGPPAIPTEELRKILDNADADYLLVLNQYYFRWQDQPLRTLFHIVSCILSDKDEDEVYRGNNFFTCINLKNPDKLRKSNRKNSSKTASSIIKTLDED